MSNFDRDFNGPDPMRMLPSQLGWRIRLNGFLLIVALFLLCLLPFVFWHAMTSALERLHLHPAMAALLVVGMFIGGAFNIPMWSIRRDDETPVYEMANVEGVWQPRRVESGEAETIVAVNVGGCVIPALLVAWQVWFLVDDPISTLIACATIAGVNVAACYFSASAGTRIGVAAPAFVPALTAVLMTWLLLPGEMNQALRPSVAFIAGVLGPLVGGNLLRLPVMVTGESPVVSIGRGGAFDGIALSGVMAALLA